MADRWNFIRLADPVVLDTSNLTKMSSASDPRTSSFAVYPDRTGMLCIWGLVDQGNRYHDYVTFNAHSGPERPGLFQASAVGVGHVIVYIGIEKIAELRANRLVNGSQDVIHKGPISQALQAAVSDHIERVRREVTEEVWRDRDHWPASLGDAWTGSLCRMLLRIQGLRHGGALLLTPDGSGTGLDIKYRINYERLRTALHRSAVLRIRETHTDDVISGDFLDSEADQMPVEFYLDAVVFGNDLEECENELDGAVWFVSLLSRVDGLVLLSPGLDVRGFGVEITASEQPRRLLVAGDAQGSRSRLRELDYRQYGTRHRSMMRYCHAVPGSVGFVVSQDGDVRAITRVHDDVVVWHNIRLQRDDIRRSRRG